MAQILESPTKNIREKLESLHLGSSGDERKPTSRNHLLIPPLLANEKFEGEESVVENKWDEQDTVIHNTNAGDISLADFMKVKLNLKDGQSKKIDPTLKRNIIQHKNLDIKLKENLPIHDMDSESNITWEHLKNDYGINNEDIYDLKGYDTDQTEAQSSESIDFTSDDYNKSAFSFQEMPKIKISGSTLNSGKVTSFQTKYIDSPLDTPKLIKPTLISVVTKDPINFKVPLKLITPTDLSMIYDDDLEKWTKQQKVKTQKASQAEVTSVSSIDISFSESKKSLISALTTTLTPSSDWDKVTSVDLSNFKLLSLTKLAEYLPTLTKLKATDNRLTSFDGIPSNIESLNLSLNIICDHLNSVSRFKSVVSINLSGNKISKTAAFKHLPNLTTLDLSDNKINGKLTFSPGDFPKLKELDLSKNKLSSIEGMKYMGLRKLLINDNPLQYGFELSNTSIEDLEVVGNANSIILGTNNHSISLKKLSVDKKVSLKGSFPMMQEFQAINYNLEFLEDGNDSPLLNPNLESLVIKNSGVTEKTFDKIIKKFPHLSSIDLENNLILGSFEYLLSFISFYGENLKSFNIDNNPLSSYLKGQEDKDNFKQMILKVMKGEP